MQIQLTADEVTTFDEIANRLRARGGDHADVGIGDVLRAALVVTKPQGDIEVPPGSDSATAIARFEDLTIDKIEPGVDLIREAEHRKLVMLSMTTTPARGGGDWVDHEIARANEERHVGQ